jgi:hypothetical protein
MAWLEKSKTKFKVGDKVRAVRGTEGYYPFLGVLNREGENNNLCGIVLYSECKVYKEGDHFCLDAKHFELVKGESKELEILVRKANEGWKAQQILDDKYLDFIEISTDGIGHWHRPVSSSDGLYRIRIKPLPQFESFKVGNNWEVNFEAGSQISIIFIGCKDFNAKDLWYALENLTKDSSAQHTLKDGTILNAMRGGIVCNGKESITWEEAEKIRDALERVLS